MAGLRDGEFCVLADGWIKIERKDYEVGLSKARAGRLLLGLNQLLLRVAGKLILVDTGLGLKWSPREVGLLGYQRPRRLLTELSLIGVKPRDVDIVVFSHLHYDHSGGATCREAGGAIAPSFTNAVYCVQLQELQIASDPPLGSVDDYRREDFQPLQQAGLLRPVEGEFEVAPGVTLHPAPGHTGGHQVVVARLGSQVVFYSGDLFSTLSHANLQVTMVYDDDRETLLEQRRRWLDAARAGAWKVVFCHAARHPVGVLRPIRNNRRLSPESNE